MSEFKIKNVIPTASEAKGILASDGVYFPSNTNLFKMKKNSFSLVSSCDGVIKQFAVNGDFSFLCTDDRIYFNHFQHFIGSLKRSATAIDSFDDFFAIGNNNVLEIWNIPTEYKFCLFRLQSKIVGHHRTITNIKILSSKHIVTASEDCSIRLFDLEKKTSKVIAVLNDIPTGLHSINNQVIATVKNGSVVTVDLDTLEYKNLKFSGEIVSSSSHNDVLAIAIKNMIIENKNEEFELLPSRNEVPKSKELSKNQTLVLLQNFEEIFRCEISTALTEIALENSILHIRSPDFISSFDIQTESFIHTLNLPTILNISVYKNLLAASASDHSVYIYSDNTCISKLQDPKAKGDVIASHILPSKCVVIYSTGHISCFNINDSHCFRSFSISDTPFSSLASSCVSDDGCFVFISDNVNIKIIDLMKGKLIDTINLHSPVLNMKFYRDYLYTLELGKVLTKHSVFSGLSDNVVIEDLPIGFCVKNSNIIVSTVKDLIVYDLDLNYVDSFGVLLESRNRSEMYSKNKSVEIVDFDSSYVYCGGQSNYLKIFENSFSVKKKKVLMKTPLVQILTVSRNKNLENFKSKIFREKETAFDKTNLIEVKNVFSSNSKLYILTNEGVSIYENIETSFSPVEFDIKPTEEFVKNNLENSLKSLIAAIKLNDASLLQMVINNCADIDFTVKYLPNRFIDQFLFFIFETLKQDFTNIKLIEFLNKLVFYHRATFPGLYESLSSGIRPIYEEVKRNNFLLKSITKK